MREIWLIAEGRLQPPPPQPTITGKNALLVMIMRVSLNVVADLEVNSLQVRLQQYGITIAARNLHAWDTSKGQNQQQNEDYHPYDHHLN